VSKIAINDKRTVLHLVKYIIFLSLLFVFEGFILWRIIAFTTTKNNMLIDIFEFIFSFEFIDNTKIYKIINPPTISSIIIKDNHGICMFRAIKVDPKIVIKLIDII
jgi:hypothetical protein